MKLGLYEHGLENMKFRLLFDLFEPRSDLVEEMSILCSSRLMIVRTSWGDRLSASCSRPMISGRRSAGYTARLSTDEESTSAPRFRARRM